MEAPGRKPRLLLVGGAGGFVGRAVLPELLPEYTVRSVHRRPAPNEEGHVEWIRADVAAVSDWSAMMDGVDVVLNLAWYRWESEERFRRLQEGLLGLVKAAAQRGVRRFLHVSVPPASASMEATLPYLFYKRRVDAAVAGSGLSFRILRPTMLFGPGDVLLGVMLRLMRRYPFFPMFGDGRYHVSPIAVADLARVLRREASGSGQGTVDLGGPERLEYRVLTDRMFRALEKKPRYWRLSATGARRLTGLMVALGSTILYPYEVEWLMSDMLGLPPYEGLDSPLINVGAYLDSLVRPRAGSMP